MPVWAQLVPQPASERWLRQARCDPKLENFARCVFLRFLETNAVRKENSKKIREFLNETCEGNNVKCVSHEATPEQPERVREQRLGLMDICGWRSEANFDGIDAGLKYWIKLNQVERIKQNQTPSIMFDPILRIRCHILLQGKWIHGANGNASCSSDYMRCLESSKLQIPMKRWRNGKNGETISGKWYLTKRHQSYIALSDFDVVVFHCIHDSMWQFCSARHFFKAGPFYIHFWAKSLTLEENTYKDGSNMFLLNMFYLIFAVFTGT